MYIIVASTASREDLASWDEKKSRNKTDSKRRGFNRGRLFTETERAPANNLYYYPFKYIPHDNQLWLALSRIQWVDDGRTPPGTALPIGLRWVVALAHNNNTRGGQSRYVLHSSVCHNWFQYISGTPCTWAIFWVGFDYFGGNQNNGKEVWWSASELESISNKNFCSFVFIALNVLGGLMKASLMKYSTAQS